MARKQKRRDRTARASRTVRAAQHQPSASSSPSLPWRQRIGALIFSAAPSDTETSSWKYLWHLLFAAFIVRCAIALSGDFILHPDELLQYLEPAHYAAFGNGVLYWEFIHGARSWLIPGVITGVLTVLDTVGLGRPAVYVPAVKVVFCLFSLILPWAMYRFTQVTVNESAARLALVFGCFWYELAAMAHKPFTEFVSATLLMLALALSVGNRATVRRNLFMLGLLAALAGAIRMQYAPVALLLLVLRSLNLRGRGLAMLWGGAALLTVLVGMLEWLTWGAPFHSYLTNFLVNLALDDTHRSGEAGRWVIVAQLITAGGGASLLAFVVGARFAKRHMLILLVSGVTLLVHLFPEHREYRFLHLLIPCWLILLAAWLAQLDARAAYIKRYGSILLIAFGIPALLNIFPPQSWVYKNYLMEPSVYFFRNQQPIYKVTEALAKDDDVRGLLFYSDQTNTYYYTAGYYYLHHSVPFYTRLTLQIATAQRPDATLPELVSHVIVENDALTEIDGFELVRRHKNLSTWRRVDNSQPVIAWEETRVLNTQRWFNQIRPTRLLPKLSSPLMDFLIDESFWNKTPPKVQLKKN